MRNHPLRPHHQAQPRPVMGGRLAAQQASRSLDGAHKALCATKEALEKAPTTPHSRDGLKAIARALREVSGATACSDHIADRIRL